MVYKICNKEIFLVNHQLTSHTWRKFECAKKDVDLLVFVYSCLARKYGIEILEHQSGPTILKSKNALLSVNEKWTEACITLLDGQKEGLEDVLIAAIMTYLSTRQGIMVHSSLIDFNGKGVMFVGPSGIGKTTQAELWMEYRNAVIINGDMVLVSVENNEFRGYGCPWHGSTIYCENRQIPLSGIIVLEQSKENTIKRLSGITLVERMMKNVFLPHWYQKGVEAAMETVDHLLSNVPVYLMKCRPDEESVELVERVLFDKK